MKTLEEIYCEHLALKPGFIVSIVSDSDWGFVIKAHALLEAALTNLIVTRFKEPLLMRILSNLATSSEDFGKLSVLKEMNLINKERRAFVRAFSRLRNTFAHDIRKIDSTIQQYHDEDAKRASELKAAMAPLFGEPLNFEGKDIPRDQFIVKNLRLALWTATLATMNALINEKGKLLSSEASVPDGTIAIATRVERSPKAP